MTAEPGSWWLVLLGGLAGQAIRVAEADRGRAALLATVSHDLRAPLAAAKAAVSGLRAGDARLTTDDRADLLAAAEESLDRLAHLAASLLDVSRLQAGARAVFPRPAHVGEIVAAALEALGPQPKPWNPKTPPAAGSPWSSRCPPPPPGPPQRPAAPAGYGLLDEAGSAPEANISASFRMSPIVAMVFGGIAYFADG